MYMRTPILVLILAEVYYYMWFDYFLLQITFTTLDFVLD